MKRAMNGGSLALVAAVALSGAILAPAAAGAQSVPGAIAKRSAQNAVAATNAHTQAMTNTSSTPTTLPGQNGAATQARPAGTPTPAGKAGATPAAVAGNGATPAPKPAPAAAAPTAPAKGAQPATAKGAAPRYAATAGKGQGAASVSVSESGAATQLTFSRETFEYAGRGRRDPFLSLMKSGDLRPLYQDLKLVTVLYDPTGRNSVAIMRDLSTKDQYRVKVGQTLGRMRVSQIQPKQVVFALEEFGYSRQEVLALNDSTKARKQ